MSAFLGIGIVLLALIGLGIAALFIHIVVWLLAAVGVLVGDPWAWLQAGFWPRFGAAGGGFVGGGGGLKQAPRFGRSWV